MGMCTQCMWDVPPSMENKLDLQPVFRTCGACHHLISIGPDDSVADLRHKLIYGRPRHPESKLQSWIAVSIGQVSQDVLANFTPGLRGSLSQVLSLWISGPSLCSDSCKSSGGIRIKFWYAIGSSNSVWCTDPLLHTLPNLAMA